MNEATRVTDPGSHARAVERTETDPPRRFAWQRLRKTLMVLGVALACYVALSLFAHRLPAFASITKSAQLVVGVIALFYLIRTWMPRHGQRRHGERRHNEDRRD